MYGRQLSAIHDRWFRRPALDAAEHLRSLLGEPDGPIIDLGCGSGVLLQRFYRSGVQSHGFDLSPEMIAICRTRMPGFRFEVADALAAPLSPARAITAVGEVLSYATADLEDPESSLLAFFGAVAENLLPGGVLLFDILGDDHSYDYGTFRDEPEYSLFVQSSRTGNVVERTIVSFLRSGETYARSSEVHRLRVFPADFVEDLLDRSGLDVRTSDGYGRGRLPSGRIAFESRRRGTRARGPTLPLSTRGP